MCFLICLLVVSKLSLVKLGNKELYSYDKCECTIVEAPNIFINIQYTAKIKPMTNLAFLFL